MHAREEIAEKNRRLKNLRQRVERKNREIEALRKELAEAQRSRGPTHSVPESPPVFFLTGRAKSGTSWLMQMLDAHPDILCKGEGRFFGRHHMRNDPEQARIKLQPTSLYGAMANSEYLRAWIERSVWSKNAGAEEHLVNLTGLAIDYFLTRRLSESGKKIVGDKTPFTGVEVVREIAEIRPDAKLIHIIRDGRDVAISAVHHMWNHALQEGGFHKLMPEELEKRDAYRSDPQTFIESGRSIFTGRQLAGTARNWAETVSRTMRDGSELLGDNCAKIRYEDLLERPEEEVRRLLEFLKADIGEETVRHCVETASFEKRTKGRERGREDSTAFLRKGVAGDWKNIFTDEDKRVFKEEAGDLLIELGYEKDFGW